MHRSSEKLHLTKNIPREIYRKGHLVQTRLMHRVPPLGAGVAMEAVSPMTFLDGKQGHNRKYRRHQFKGRFNPNSVKAAFPSLQKHLRRTFGGKNGPTKQWNGPCGSGVQFRKPLQGNLSKKLHLTKNIPRFRRQQADR